MNVTTEDVLAALTEFRERVAERPKGVFTAKEAAAAKGVSLSTVQRWLKEMAAEGRLEVLTFRGMRVNGYAYPITAYRVKKR